MLRILTIIFFVCLLNGISCIQKAGSKLSSIDSSVVQKTDMPDSSQNQSAFLLKPLGWTSDYEHIFSVDQISELDSIISAFEKETTNEIAIVTIDSSFTTKDHFDDFTLEMANNWGVGKKGKNNGILIGISAGLRRIRIHNGYGIEAKLTDNETKRIIDDVIIPQFKEHKYFEGIKSGLLQLVKMVR